MGRLMRKRTNYSKEFKEFLKQQAQMKLTLTELTENLNARFPEYNLTNRKVTAICATNHISRVKPDSKMTDTEKKYAEDHITIVYKYLYQNSLDIDEWFDIVIFGYLRAVMRYHREEKLKQYAFATIVWRAMSADILNHKRYISRRKQVYMPLSLEKAVTESGAGLHEVIPDESAERQYLDIEFGHDMELLHGEQAKAKEYLGNDVF